MRNYYDGLPIGMTGLRNIDQRYYASAYGRFNTADPYSGSGKTGRPASWNRYAYTLGDPVNANDPRGLDLSIDPSENEFADSGLYDYEGCTNPVMIEIAFQNGGDIGNCPQYYGAPIITENPVPTAPTCGQVLNLSMSNVTSTAADLLGVTSFFEDEAAVPAGGNLSSTMSSIWEGIDWTFENRANLSPRQAAAFYGRGNVPSSFQGVVTGPTGSQVWSNGQLASNFAAQLRGILAGSATSSLCNGLTDASAIAVGVNSGYIPNNVPGALQFASGGVVPGHSPGVVEGTVATFGTFTFYQPIYPARKPRR